MPQVFAGRRSFGEFTTLAIASKIVDGKWLARPREVQGLGLTDSVWNMTVRCWNQDPAQRPTIREVVRLLREWSVLPLPLPLSPWNQHRDVSLAATG